MLRNKFANIKKPLRRGKWIEENVPVGFASNRFAYPSLITATQEVFKIDTLNGMTTAQGKFHKSNCQICGHTSREYIRTNKCSICMAAKPIWDKRGWAKYSSAKA